MNELYFENALKFSGICQSYLIQVADFLSEIRNNKAFDV